MLSVLYKRVLSYFFYFSQKKQEYIWKLYPHILATHLRLWNTYQFLYKKAKWWYEYFAGIVYWSFVTHPYYEEYPDFQERLADCIADFVCLSYNFLEYFIESSVYALEDLVHSKSNIIVDFIDFLLVDWRAWRPVP